MDKVVIHRAGGYGRLKLESHPDPEPGAGEVLVRIQASGINFADAIVRQGLYKSAKRYVGWPITPGFEFSGQVAKTGAGVRNWMGGEPVFGVTRFGGYATHACVQEHQVLPLPRSLSPEQAAGFPAVHLTAYHALFHHCVIRPGMRALVHSAAGGVGTALLQLLRIADVYAVGVVGASHKVAVAHQFGAGDVIDKSTRELWPAAERLAPDGYDLIFDGNGPATLRQSFAHLAPTGKLVSYGFHSMFDKRGGFPNYLKLVAQWLRIPRFNPLDLVDQNKSVIGFNLSFLFGKRELLRAGIEQLVRWLDEGRLQPPQVTTYPAAQVADAQRALESGQTTGKLVLTW